MTKSPASQGAAALSVSFTPELTSEDGQVTTTSQQVAQHFGKRHSDVMRAIKMLECSAEFSLRNFAQSDFFDERGKRRSAYRMTRNGFTFLAMSFTGEEAAQWKEAYIEAFGKMETELLANRQAAALQIQDRLRTELRGSMEAVNSLTIRNQVLTHDYIDLQGQLIQSQAKQIRLMGTVQSMHRGREAREAKLAIIQMTREGKSREQIVAATERTFNHVRQVLFQARAAGILPPLAAPVSPQTNLFTEVA